MGNPKPTYLSELKRRDALRRKMLHQRAWAITCLVVAVGLSIWAYDNAFGRVMCGGVEMTPETDLVCAAADSEPGSGGLSYEEKKELQHNLVPFLVVAAVVLVGVSLLQFTNMVGTWREVRAVELPEKPVVEPRILPTAREKLSGGSRTIVVRLSNPKGKAGVVSYGVDGRATIEERKVALPWEATFTAEGGDTVLISGYTNRPIWLVAQILVDGAEVERREGGPMVSCRHRIDTRKPANP